MNKYYNVEKVCQFQRGLNDKTKQNKVLCRDNISAVIDDIVHALVTVYPRIDYTSSGGIYNLITLFKKYGPRDAIGFQMTKAYISEMNNK